MATKKTTKTTGSAPTKKKAAAKTTKTATKAASKPAAAKAAPSKAGFDDIARAAYLNYRKRVDHGLPGNPESDWLQAEQDLKAKG
ncbi:MAG TPA: hypothetical protein VFY13_07890 [Luteolibacter sp.]|nr:hypothetical protein [Luteolibacter sp.]